MDSPWSAKRDGIHLDPFVVLSFSMLNNSATEQTIQLSHFVSGSS
jgi:hypothetical protein